MNFIELNDLPIYDLYSEFLRLLKDNKISWHPTSDDQICINSTPDSPSDYLKGRGSLFLDWDNSYFENGNIVVPNRQIPLKEEDFTTLCTAFKESLFEEVYNQLVNRYVVGRIRIMKSKPKTCLTWHTDDTPRIHYPMKTQEGCIMVIEDEAKHLEENKWYYTNTVVPHTAFNGSKEERIHLVVVILGTK